MTSITRNLPSFVKDLGVAVVGEKCYISLVENLEFGDVPCLKFAVSKVLGIGIVVGGSIVKVPQLLLIVNAKSAQGLSLESYILETLSYAITLVYSFRNELPFSTYGENLFLTIQNTLITLLIIAYAPSSSSRTPAPLAISTLVTAFAALARVPSGVLSYLQMATVPLSLASKLPQIIQNSQAKSTGQLSSFAVVAQIVGCLARLFTTATEVGDPILVAGFGMALLLNCVLGAQVWMYWGTKAAVEAKAKVKVGEVKAEAVEVAPIAEKIADKVKEEETAYSTTWTPSTPKNMQRMSTPPPSGGRKWARKVD
ncbi:hypothetical protein PC9H_000073 [Pleurotus ostreatus]|uniref:Mannose-P-dolichol utilization defect 1 protein homolog n=1 Tax=Pleurotus ostreatus TaxID=5322 RepID=A0A8H7A314_PLEOS|nr:uncharacterized protein PC9H_000073 [Pleurotus ostreatus]KAF7439737.1 hypothetical protein PC9H_000073 [Pleurotus ostreatus]KAJ8701109.1 hypothetical protein PTI98_004067 [Pleurotus ostreatus]